MTGVRGNPQAKLRRYQPDTLACHDVHDAASSINQLIGAMRVFVYVEPAGILVRQRRNQHAVWWIISRHEAVSHCRYIMA